VSDDSSTVARTPGLVAYASFTARLSALTSDAIVMTVALASILLVGTFLENVSRSGRVEAALIWAVIFLYEPLFVWQRGATIGHRRLDLIVVTSEGRTPGFFRALTRFLIKSVLGPFGFIPMFLTRRHQALQDLLTGTRVIIHDPSRAESHHVSFERSADWLDGGPSALRRISMIIVFVAVLFLACLAFVVGIMSRGCPTQRECTAGEHLLLQGSTWGWLAATVLVVIAGWTGRLPGARRRTVPAAAVQVT
jgi:uncharacterized RDD family membrane protein YckC